MRSHSRLSFPAETHFIPQLFAAYGDVQSGPDMQKLADRLLRLRWVVRWECTFDLERLYAATSYASLIDELFTAWLRKEGKKRWGDKTPHNVFHIPVLHMLFPDARFIHIYRDGRDVVRSWVRAPFGPTNIVEAAAEWQRFVRAGQQGGATLPPTQYLEIRYETLLADPEATLRSVCRFIDESFEPAMLTPNPLLFHQRLQRVPVFGGMVRGLGGEPLLVQTNSYKWKTAMTPEERGVVEAVAGAMLQTLGYETEGYPRTISSIERRFWRLHSRVKETLVKLNTRDKLPWIGTVLFMNRAALRAKFRTPKQS